MNEKFNKAIDEIKNYLFNFDSKRFYGDYTYEGKKYKASNLLFSLLISKYLESDFEYVENIDISELTKLLTKNVIPKISDLHIRESYVMLLKEILDITDQVVIMNSVTFSFHEILTNKIDVSDLKEELNTHLNEDMRFSLPFMESIEDKMLDRFDEAKSPLMKLLKSKARGNRKQLSQQFLAIGYKVDKQSNILTRPIFDSLIDGIKDPLSFYNQAIGCRNAIIQGTNSVADSGYLNRKLSFGTIDINLSDEQDCGSTRYLEVEVTKSNKNSLLNGRYIFDDVDGKLKYIKSNMVDDYVGKVVKLRSPITCKCKDGICKTCYGALSAVNKNLSIGLLAATTIAEIITQRLLSTKHLMEASIEKDNQTIMEYITISHEDDVIKCIKPFKLHINKYGKIFLIDSDNNVKEEFKHNFKNIKLDDDTLLSSITEMYEKEFNVGDIVFKNIRRYINSDMNILLKTINRIFEKTQYMSEIDDYNLYYPHMLDLMMKMGHVQSIHSEIIMSQMVKVRNKNHYLWRLNQDEEMQIIPFTRSNLSNNLFNNILFERVDESLLDINNYLSEVKNKTKYEKLFDVNYKN